METKILIYLDTHVVLWLYQRKGEGLSERARHSLELDFFQEVGRTTLGSSPVFDYLHQQFDLQLCKKSFTDVVRSASRLSWTRDPSDRVITAQSAIDQNRLITKDKIIRQHYQHSVW